MITDIHLQNFRSYIDDSFELSPNVNIVVGPNASGKTNLLESILVMARGNSFRARDTELINNKKDWARIEVTQENLNRVIKIERLEQNKSSKIFEINTKKVIRLNLSQTLPVVLFEPNHLLLLIGSPELRRNYIDDILDQTVIGYKALKSKYKRALTQRNTLLKRPGSRTSELFVWNVRLSELGGKIFKERQSLTKVLDDDITAVYNSISGGKEDINLSYKTNIKSDNYESDLLKKLENVSEEDMRRGFTAYGPHRDDLQILINKKTASEVASRGETRTILLALKIIETYIIEKTRGEKPILLFDDVFSELDGARRLSLAEVLKEYQVFITTTDADIVLNKFIHSANIIPIGKYNT